MSSYNEDRLVEYVSAHPEAGVNAIAEHFRIDGAGAWALIIDAERHGLIESYHDPDMPWRFKPTPAATMRRNLIDGGYMHEGDA